MNTKFNVGNKEKHEVEFFFDRCSGKINFKVDGQIVKKHSLSFFFSTTKKYTLTIGETEKHNVEVIIKRPLIAAYAKDKGWEFTILVDGKIIKELTIETVFKEKKF